MLEGQKFACNNFADSGTALAILTDAAPDPVMLAPNTPTTTRLLTRAMLPDPWPKSRVAKIADTFLSPGRIGRVYIMRSGAEVGNVRNGTKASMWWHNGR